MTEEEQIELAMTRSLMEFDREILKECSSTLSTIASLSQFDLLTFTRDDLENVLLLVLL
jgi:hypothetical protein